jgi:membrane protein CcdC involved in cytochrome C biogenesis
VHGNLVQYGISALVLFVVLGLRLRSMSRVRPLNTGQIWIAPLILLILAGFTLAAHPPGGLALAAGGGALIAGGLLGWQRGRMIHIFRDPATGKLFQKASPAAMLLLVGVILLRFVFRAVMGQPSGGAALSNQALMLTDALLMFAIGLLVATRVEMALRARRIATGDEAVGTVPTTE